MEGDQRKWAGILRNHATLSLTATMYTLRGRGRRWVTCTERVSALSSNQLDTSLAQATNVFVALGGGWRLVVHHASAVALAEPGAWAADSESVH